MNEDEVRSVAFKAAVGLLNRLGTGSRIDQSVLDALTDEAREGLLARGLVVGHPLLAAVPPSEPNVKVARTLSRKLVDIDRNLRVKLSTAANDAMKRTLEKAGAKLVSKTRAASGAALRPYTQQHMPTYCLPIRIPRTVIAAVGLDEHQLLDTAFNDLHDQFDRWVGDAQRSAARVAARIVGQSPDDAVAKLRGAQDIARDQGWNRLSQQMRSRAIDLLGADTEVAADTLVPMGMVRAALAFAGGTSATSAGIGSSGHAVSSDDVIGQIGTGGIIGTYLEANDASVYEFEWTHGPSDRPFQPHEDLDGTLFGNFDDPALAIEGGFPDTGFYHPGDHDGCSCDFIQHWAVTAEDAASAA